jgi:hypothetical protein
MLNTIQEATEVSLNAYNRYRIKKHWIKITEINLDFWGQCLEVLTEQLQEENDRLRTNPRIIEAEEKLLACCCTRW